MDFIQFVIDLVTKMGGLFSAALSLLTYELSIPLVGDFSVWALLGGAGLVTLIIAGLIKAIAPFT